MAPLVSSQWVLRAVGRSEHRARALASYTWLPSSAAGWKLWPQEYLESGRRDPAACRLDGLASVFASFACSHFGAQTEQG